MRTLLLSARYSDNLGDGVIGDCLEWMIQHLRPDSEVTHVDIAPRVKFSPRDASRVSPSKRLFYSLPNSLRALAVLAAWPIQRHRLSTLWDGAFGLPSHSGRCAIIAGGQLVSDVALNFPLKIGYASKRLAAEDIPVGVFAAGVSANFSKLGRALFERAFTRADLRWFGARDNDSFANVRSAFSLGEGVSHLTIDPAIWSSDAYGITKKKSGRRTVGVGVAHPAELGAHIPGGTTNAEEMIEFFHSLTPILLRQGIKPVLFNNGSAEDSYFTEQVAQHLRSSGIEIDVAARPTTPRELVDTISRFDSLIAHRLHSNIIGYALGIPTVGMRWDRKVEAFFVETGRTGYCLEALDPEIASQCLLRAVSCADSEVDAERLRELKTFAMANLESLMRTLES